MKEKELVELLNTLVKEPHEQEWLEFKHNFHNLEEIGETISALANSACLHQKPFGYLVFGVEDGSHKIVGTTFKAKTHKKNNEDIEPWLATRLNPRIDFVVEEFEYLLGIHISLFKVPAAINRPVSFSHIEYIRVGKTNRKLADFPDKAAKIWRNHQNLSWEKGVAKSNVAASEVIELLSTQTYFELLKLPYPSAQQAVIDRFLAETFINKTPVGYDITKLGAILLAKNLNDFDELARKAVRVIVYKGTNKLETEREQIDAKGYAAGFEGLIDWINGQLPANEEIGKALREEHRMYPAIAIRELIANALIHQDFLEKGFPTIELFKDRIEISNPGVPLIKPERFFDPKTGS
jgi:ATP-dependent DNA helicase RecG